MHASPSTSVAPRMVGVSMMASNSRPLTMSQRGLEVLRLLTAAISLASLLPLSSHLTFLILAGRLQPTSACNAVQLYLLGGLLPSGTQGKGPEEFLRVVWL